MQFTVLLLIDFCIYNTFTTFSAWLNNPFHHIYCFLHVWSPNHLSHIAFFLMKISLHVFCFLCLWSCHSIIMFLYTSQMRQMILWWSFFLWLISLMILYRSIQIAKNCLIFVFSYGQVKCYYVYVSKFLFPVIYS